MLFPKNKNQLITTVFFIVTLSVPLLSCARSGGHDRSKGPPPEATQACESLSVGEACSFSGRRGEVVGTCINPPENDDRLACAPEDMKR